MSWFGIIKTEFEFDVDNPEGGRYDRNTGEVFINLANSEYRNAIGMSEDDFVENLTDTLTEEYTHMSIDPEITEVFMEYLENNFDIEFQDIPGWQIKSVVVNTYGNYEDREKFGIRVIRNDC